MTKSVAATIVATAARIGTSTLESYCVLVYIKNITSVEKRTISATVALDHNRKFFHFFFENGNIARIRRNIGGYNYDRKALLTVE